MPRSKPQPVITVFDDYSFQWSYCRASSQPPPHHTGTTGALSDEQPRSVLTTESRGGQTICHHLCSSGMKLRLQLSYTLQSQTLTEDLSPVLAGQPLHAKTQLNSELASTFPGLQYFNKRAVLKQIRTKTEKKRNYSCLFSLFIPGRKKTWDHIRQENNAHSL